MNLAVISFTKAGSILNHRIKSLIEETHSCTCYYKGRCEENLSLIKVEECLHEWCNNIFNHVNGILFIGAAGIAVRTIAPFLKDKTKDPLVIVIDEKASFVISLLSGHIGGGNELTLQLSELLHATPVITTATDINQNFAVDVFATKERLSIADMSTAKEISAAILEGKKIGLVSQFVIDGRIPDELVPIKDESMEIGICISLNEEEKPFTRTLNLIPKRVIIGIGCKKNTDKKLFEEFVLRTLKEQHISIYAIETIASIDLKANESCIKGFAQKYQIPFVTYSAKELNEVEGIFEESEFVKQVTGVGNVCERSAMIACKNPKLILGKKAYEGITIALAIDSEMRGIRFE